MGSILMIFSFILIAPWLLIIATPLILIGVMLMGIGFTLIKVFNKFMEAPTAVIVDDDSVASSFLEKILQNQGYRTEVYLDPVMALQRLKNRKWDVLALDVEMPEMSGPELLSRLDKSPSKHLDYGKVFFYTGKKQAVNYDVPKSRVHLLGTWEKQMGIDQTILSHLIPVHTTGY